MKRFLFQLIIVFVIFSVSDSVMGQSFPFQTSPTGSYVPAPHIFQDPSTLIQKMGMHYSACELKMRASSKLGSITFTTSSTSSLNAGSVVNVYLDNSQYCDLRTWRSWTDVNDSIDASGQAQLVIINATNFRLVFSSALANSFVYEGGGLDVFVEGLGQVSTETLSGFESAGNVGFWGLNLPVFGTNVIRPVMGGNYALTTQNIPPTCIRTVTCSNQTQYCPGEIVCMYLKKQDGVFVNDGGLSFSWERTTTPCDAASWTSVPASSSWSLQLAAPSLSGTYYYRCKITDGASLYYSSLSGTCSAAGCNDYFSITVIPALNTLGCYDEPDIESISLGARISEVEMKVNGALLLKSNTNFVNGICTTGADFYSVYARPNSGSSLTSIIEAPIISPTISWMDFSDALSSTVVPEVHPGDLIDFKVRMSNCDKPQLFNHAVRLEFDWDNNQTFETLYDFSFLEATPILSYYQGFPESLLLNPIEADSVVYQKSFIVPCDIVCGSNVVTKFRVSLKRLPTGWGDAEDYAIKSLCNDVTINFSGSNTICQGQSKLLSVGVGSTFQWNKDGVPITGATNSTFSANQSGAYTVTVQIAGCTYTSGVVHIILDNVSVNAGSDFTKTCVTNPSGSAVGESSSSGFTYAWSPSAGLSSAAISNPVANPSSTTTYTLTKTNSTTGCSSSDQVLVTVNTTLPTVNAGSDFTKTCVTNPSGSAVGESSSSGFTYAWTPSAGLSSAAISNPVANPIATTTYTLTKTNSTTGCSSSDQVLVTVDTTLPTVNAGSDFTKTCVTNPSGSAVGESSSSGFTYAWSPSSGLSSAAISNPVANPSTTTTYTLTKTNSTTGCSSSDQVLVTVDTTLPTVNAGLDFTKTCVTNPSGSAVGESSSSGFTYAWSPSSGLSSAAISNPVANPIATTTYTLTKTNSTTGCSSSDQVLVTVNTTLPTVNAGLDFTKTCVTNPSGSAVGESSSSGFTYAWSPSAGLSSAAISNPVANPSSTTTYTLTKTNSTTGCSSSDQVLVTVDATLPTVNAGLDFTKTCVTNPSGSAVGESSSSGFTYAWTPSAGLSSAAISNPVANPIATTTYTLTKTNSTTGCSSSDQVLVTVDATLPTVNAGLDQNVCAGDMVTLSGSGALTYSWNNGVLDGLSFTPIASNNYIVIGEAANGCQNSDTVAVSVTQPNTYYLDVDGDGFGSISLLLCVNPGSGYVAINGDCDDSQANIFPLQIESCNAIDDNCNGVVDEGCALGIALSTAQLTSTPQYGMPGTNFTHITDMTSTVDYPESNTGVHEKWFKFMALSNAIRIEVVGATSNDDNAIRLFSDPGLIYTSPLVPIVEENDVNNTSVGVLDQGNEVLLTDLLTEGQWYYVCVTTLAGTPGSITTKFNALLPSTCDVMPFTAYTGIYTNNCQTFKCQYRTQARRAIIHRWSSGVQVGSPLSSYTIPAPTSLITTCQLSKITPVNMTGSPQTIFISADLEYNLLDAAGNMNILFANQTSNCNFQLNSESTSNVRSTDECPVYKNYTSSVATDRSICGAMQYQWEFTMVYPSPALPVSVNGASNSRILPLSTVPGMANGQRYDVRIRSLYSDATTYSNWSSASECIRTMGAAGLTPLESVDDFDLKNANGSVFPNPTRVNSRAILNWQYENVNVIEIYNLQGQCVEKYDAALVQNKSMELKAIYAGGLYHIVLKGPQIMYCIPWMVE